MLLLLLALGSRSASGTENSEKVLGKQSRGEVILQLACEHPQGFSPITPSLSYLEGHSFVLHTCPKVARLEPVCEVGIPAPEWQGSRMIRGPPQR